MTEPIKKSLLTRWFGRALPIIAIGLFALVILRQQQLERWSEHPPNAKVAPRRLAPRFELIDHNRHLVKFERFLGRQRVVVIFFDAEQGADKDPRVRPLVDHFDKIKQAGIEIIAISTAPFYANEQAEKNMPQMECPFPLLTDIVNRNPIAWPTHRLWGAYNEEQDTPIPGLYLVARDGTIEIGPDGKPIPIADEAAVIAKLIQADWPR